MMMVGKGNDSGVVKVRVRALTSISMDQGLSEFGGLPTLIS